MKVLSMRGLMEAFVAVMAILSVVSPGGSASAQGALVDSYCTSISENDKFASDGFQLTDAASIIRQDRANYHKFGYRDQGDQSDATFGSASARERIRAMLDGGSIDPSVKRQIVNGSPEICVDIHARSISVFPASAPIIGAPAYDEGHPFFGEWDCEVATFIFTPTVYNNGSEDLAIIEIQEDSDGSYTLFFENDYLITLSGFTGDTMGWYSHASGDSFNCRRIY